MIGNLNISNLVQSKLKIPPLRQDFVYRPQIANLLNESLNHKLTTISSPAGFGKTSLVCEWLLGIRCKAAWLSLDTADDDPVRYWNHLVHALEHAIPNYFQRSLAWLQSGGSDISDPLLIPLLNEMSMLDDPLVLILDDYHLIQSEDIHRTMSYLIRHLPDNVHIVMLTRGAVPFPLGRLKVNRELLEIGRDELTFKEAECRKLFSVMGADPLSELEIHELNQLTEGWVAVLCVIAARASITPGLKSLYAINPNLLQVIDNLYEELFVTIERELQLFLLRTSIVERMCPELCNDLTGRKDALTLLTQLEHSSAFITLIEPLEQWYRYHLLLREFLHDQLKKKFPEEIRFLHEKAAKWFASRQLMDEAINHAIAGSLWELAAEWIGEYAPALIQSKRTYTIELWLQQIPEEIFAAYPEFPVVRGWTYAVIGKIDLALSDWQTLSSQLQDVSVESPRRLRQLAIEMHMIEAAIAISKQNLEGTITAAMKAMPMLPLQTRYYPATEEYTGSRLFISRGKSGFWGHLSKSLVLYGGFREVFEEQKVSLQGYNAAMLAEIAYERNLFSKALQYSDLGAISGYQTKTASVFIPSMLVRVRIMKAIRSSEGFHAEWKRLEEGIRHIGADAHWQDLIFAFQVREALKEEKSGIVSEWMEISRLTERGDLSVAREYEYGTLIRVLLWQNRLAEAEKLLDGFRALMAAEDRYAHLLELDLLRTVLYAKKGNLGHALSLLDKTIELAAPEGYIRIFLDEGQDIIRLLFKSAKLHSANQSPNASYLQLLLDSLQESSTPETEGDHSNEKLLETLSQREIDILNCISRGMTNLQIGEKLGLSEGTVKGYNNQLYAKLGVRNRTQAIERARVAGILL